MNATIRKFHALPGVWQLWTLPVMSSAFTSSALHAQAKAGQAKLPYLLFMALAVVELGALAAWYVFYLSDNFETIASYSAGGLFLLSGLALIVFTRSYAKRHQPAFHEFLIKQGYAAERPELLATANQ